MKFNKLRDNWEKLGNSDPFWAVLSEPEMINNKWDLPSFFNSGKIEINWLMTKLKRDFDLKQENVLDFGCGVGRLSQPLCEYFENVIGVDIARSMIEKANELNQFGKRCQYIQNNSPTLEQFGDNSFDLIYSNITLQHMEPKYAIKYIQEFIRLIKRGGLAVFFVPHSPPFLLQIIPRPIQNFYRKLKYGKSEIIEMFWINQKDILKTINNADGKLINSEPSHAAGKGWKGNLYFVEKLG